MFGVLVVRVQVQRRKKEVSVSRAASQNKGHARLFPRPEVLCDDQSDRNGCGAVFLLC